MPIQRRTLIVWLAGFAIWTALAALVSAQGAIWTMYRGDTVDWVELFAFGLADWYTCGLFVPLLVYTTRRWPLDRRQLFTRIPIQATLIAAVSVAKIALFMPVRDRLIPRNTLTFTDSLARGLISEIVAFGAVVGALHAIEFYRRYRDGETKLLQLQARLSDAQLRALRAQLNPHFLFNTLNAATTLLHRDPDRADVMLTRLGELLRLTLRSDPSHEVPLSEEIAVLERYLGIMRTRFSDRVTVHCDVDPRAADGLVPSFILQPIVENAFEHGIAKLKRPGEVHIQARAANASLVLTVRDDGPGLESVEPGGVGLANTRNRLAELYGPAGTLHMFSPKEGGTIVEVRLPLRSAAGAPA
jgi:signal transduction histidine kinase